MHRIGPAVGLLLLGVVSGCASNNPHCHGGQFISEFRPGDTPETTRAPYKATYILYQWRKPPEGEPPHTWMPDHEVTEMYVRGLDKGDRIGFEKGEKDEVFAIAGCEKIALEAARYCWHISHDSEKRGLPRIVHEMCEMTTEIVTTIVVLPLGIVLLIVLLPVFILLLPIFFWLALAFFFC